jgi:hypothetical protein
METGGKKTVPDALPAESVCDCTQKTEQHNNMIKEKRIRIDNISIQDSARQIRHNCYTGSSRPN